MSNAEAVVSSTLATRIRTLRQKRVLSLDALAKKTGLSKGTVVALENGKANPSISVLCRLAAAFSLSVSDLLAAPVEGASGAIERTTPQILWSSPHGSRAQLQASTSGQTMFELWTWTMVPGDVFRAEGHSPNTRELITVFEGVVRISVGADTIVLNANESARLVTDQDHSYQAEGELPARFTMAVLERGGQSDELAE
ncbi:helix-turn-helix domain-containing protein [Neorhizobium alkalisoli]|uniref:helix-turn-helix domain-containing protein n=1 Tax=Neorhizobium alkalisoli TaxID=528178 RepID=UPI002477F064|nr:XRE family transcriptional regulator [Neorhizobium alkalisoli]